MTRVAALAECDLFIEFYAIAPLTPGLSKRPSFLADDNAAPSVEWTLSGYLSSPTCENKSFASDMAGAIRI